MNIRTLLKSGRETLQDRGLIHPQADAEMILAAILNCDRNHLIAHDDEVIGRQQEESFWENVANRCSGMPIQYIRGRQEFWGRDFIVGPEVLIPRPESELLVEHGIRIARGNRKSDEAERLMIADIGTGSGCLGISMAIELPRARVVATDISGGAIAIARENAARHQVLDRMMFLVGELGQPLSARHAQGFFDMIVCNPPYGSLDNRELFEREVIEYEPHQALFGGKEGTEIMARLIPEARELLKPRGYLLMEIGIGQSEAVAAMLQEGWEAMECYADLQGIPRCFIARSCRYL